MVFVLAAKAAAKGAAAGLPSAELVILPAVLLGLVIAFVELVFVHQDERGMGWLAHGLHAVPVTMIFTFITMNVPYVMSKIPAAGSYQSWMEPVVIIVIGFIAMGKVLTAAAIAGRVGEKKFHVFIIGALIIAAPYAWKYVLKATIGPMLPFS
ncbi:MAG: hypothetical protein ABIJ21_02425 [Nanoarchaeota archaeon]